MRVAVLGAGSSVTAVDRCDLVVEGRATPRDASRGRLRRAPGAEGESD